MESTAEFIKMGLIQAMETIMTPENFRKAKELCNKATGGVWTWEPDTVFGSDVTMYTVYAGRDNQHHGLNLFGRLYPDANGFNNLEFICKARELLPEALAKIEVLERELSDLRKKFEKSSQSPEKTKKIKKLKPPTP